MSAIGGQPSPDALLHAANRAVKLTGRSASRMMAFYGGT